MPSFGHILSWECCVPWHRSMKKEKLKKIMMMMVMGL